MLLRPLKLDHGELLPLPVSFSCYGFSNTKPVPSTASGTEEQISS